jgi:hypothetical protein
MDTLKANLAANCVPEAIREMDVGQYEAFLKLRRALMANKVRDYYMSL